MITALEALIVVALALNALALYFIYKAMPVIEKLTSRETSQMMASQLEMLGNLSARMTAVEASLRQETRTDE